MAFEGDISEKICLDVTISKKAWFITFVYRSPYNNNKDIFLVIFQKPCVSQQGNTRYKKYIIIISGLNIDTLNKKKDNGNTFM